MDFWAGNLINTLSVKLGSFDAPCFSSRYLLYMSKMCSSLENLSWAASMQFSKNLFFLGTSTKYPPYLPQVMVSTPDSKSSDLTVLEISETIGTNLAILTREVYNLEER